MQPVSQTRMIIRVVSYLFTARKRSLGQGNIFSSMCQEFCSQRGVCLSACWDTTPGADTPQEQTPPRADIPREQTYLQEQTPSLGSDTPLAQCMLGDTVNKRAVCIILECNLVMNDINSIINYISFTSHLGNTELILTWPTILE